MTRGNVTRNITVAVLVLSVWASSLRAAPDKGVLVVPGGTTNWAWTRNDGAGYRWDIGSNGYISTGTNSAYSGGMQLKVNGTYFSWSSPGTVTKDGHEVQIGPWPRGSLRVWRRIYVDPKLGYCRWIEIFENTSTAKQSVSIEWRSSMGSTISTASTTSGKAALDKQDWGVVTATSSTPRPAVVHVFATRNSKVKPTIHYTIRSSSSFYERLTVQVAPKKTFAVCLFEAQRRPYGKAVEFLKKFRPSAELRKVASALRRIIINMGGSTLTLGNLELPRDDKHDQVILRNGDQLLGEILNEKFIIETFYGKLELPAKKAVGLSVPSSNDPHVLVGLVDGQVVAGTFLNAPLRFKLVDGNEMTLKMAELETAAYRLSPSKPDKIKLTKAMVILRDGQRLRFRASDVDYTFHTEYGKCKLSDADLQAILFDTLEGGLHRAIFKNESVLSGLMLAEQLKVTLDLGPHLEVNRHMARQFLFPVADEKRPQLASVALRNEDELFGRIAEKSLDVETDSRTITIEPETIAELEAIEGLLGRVRIKQHNGTTVTGRLTAKTMRFQIVPGPTLPLFIGHITNITCPKPAKQPAKEPDKKPDNKTTTKPKPAAPEVATTPSTPLPGPDELKKRLAELAKEIAKARDGLAATGNNLDVTKKRLADLAQAKPKDVKVRAKLAKLQAMAKQYREQMAAYEKHLAALRAKADEVKTSLRILRAEPTRLAPPPIRPPGPRPIRAPTIEAPAKITDTGIDRRNAAEAERIKEVKKTSKAYWNKRANAARDEIKWRNALRAAESKLTLERLAKDIASTKTHLAATKTHMGKITEEIANLELADPKGKDKTKARVAKLELTLKLRKTLIATYEKQLADLQAQADTLKKSLRADVRPEPRPIVIPTIEVQEEDESAAINEAAADGPMDKVPDLHELVDLPPIDEEEFE